MTKLHVFLSLTFSKTNHIWTIPPNSQSSQLNGWGPVSTRTFPQSPLSRYTQTHNARWDPGQRPVMSRLQVCGASQGATRQPGHSPPPLRGSRQAGRGRPTSGVRTPRTRQSRTHVGGVLVEAAAGLPVLLDEADAAAQQSLIRLGRREEAAGSKQGGPHQPARQSTGTVASNVDASRANTDQIQ